MRQIRMVFGTWRDIVPISWLRAVEELEGIKGSSADTQVMAETPISENGNGEPRCRIPCATDEKGQGGSGQGALCQRAG